MNMNRRATGLQSTQIGVLPDIHLWIARRRLDARSEVADFRQFVLRAKHLLEQRNRIKPLPRSAPDSAVVEVEAIEP